MTDVVRSGPRLGGHRSAVITGAVLGAAVVLTALIGPRAVHHEPGGVYRIRVADQLNLYANPDVPPSTSLGAAMVLIVVAGMSATAALVAGAREEARDDGGRLRRFFMLSAVGAAFLGVDDLIGIHESVGLTVDHWVAVAHPARVGHLLLTAYALAAGAYLWSHRDLLCRSPRALRLLGLAVSASIVVTAIEAVADHPPHVVTNPLQAVASVGLLLGYWTLIEALLIERPR